MVILTLLILATRCANYREVFVGPDVYFTDADCYARMTRVRLCAAHPGLILRHHPFENFPQGTTPHTTAPLDYLILGLSLLMRPFVPNAIDVAGAFVSPLLALGCGWFLWWWSRRMKFRYRWAMLILYTLSPILVHGTELGRPDHQSLCICLAMVAVCAEWRIQAINRLSRDKLPISPPAIRESRIRWAIAAGTTWALAIWVSAYEPLILFVIVLLALLLQDRHVLFGGERRAGWICFAAVLAIAFAIERRVPSMSILQGDLVLTNWKRTIGELRSVSPLDPIWFRWAGYMLIAAPILIWVGLRRNAVPMFMIGLLVMTYCLTMWQVRWAYFFTAVFVIALPALFEFTRSRVAVWVAFAIAVLPILQDWDEKLWPNEDEIARRLDQRRENIELRDLARGLIAVHVEPFLAPWWLSPEIAYWSGQPGVAGSSHESLAGITDSARFFLSDGSDVVRSILMKRQVSFVLTYDSERTLSNSAALLATAPSSSSLGRILDRAPTHAPDFLVLAAENGSAKLFQVRAEHD